MKGRNAARACLFSLLVVGLLLYLDKSFYYRDLSIWSTDARKKAYEALPENSLDVLFVGSSNVMCGIDPLRIWAETGIQSYNYCSRAQTLPFTYAYLQEALKTQQPECVVVDAWSVLNDHEVAGLSDAGFHLAINMDSLALSRTKIEMINTFIPAEERLYYYIPLLRNHNYYQSWETETDDTGQIFMGYCRMDGGSDSLAPPENTGVLEGILECDRVALVRIAQLCEEKGITLIVIKTPVLVAGERRERLNELAVFLQEEGIAFYDMSAEGTLPGFSFGEDMANWDHLNASGAEKTTDYMIAILTEYLEARERETHCHADVWEAEYARMTQLGE